MELLHFVVQGVTYSYAKSERLAEKCNFAANIYEYVLETPDGKKVWLTVVGDEDQVSAYGIERGWYVAQVLSEEDAAFLIKALAKFTKLDKPAAV